MPRRFLLFALALLLFLGPMGCARLTPTPPAGDGTTADGAPPSFFPSGVDDIELPAEMEPVTDRSMFITTASFLGGVLVFQGRVEMNSLADYLVAAMGKNGWTMTGAVRYQRVLLAFVKPGKSCIATLEDSGISGKTVLSLHLSADRTAAATP